jgi:hypothetical protein
VRLKAFPSIILLFSLAFAARADDRGRLLEVRSGGDGDSSSVELVGDRPLSFTTLQLQSPPRVVVDFADTDVAGIPAELSVEDGTVRRVATAAVGAHTARVVIELAADAEFDVRAKGNRLEVRVPRIAPLVARAAQPPAIENPPAAAVAQAAEEPADAAGSPPAVAASPPIVVPSPPVVVAEKEPAPEAPPSAAASLPAAPAPAAPTEAEKRASLPTISLVGSQPAAQPKPLSAAAQKGLRAQEKLAAQKRAAEELAEKKRQARATRLAAAAAEQKLAADRAAAQKQERARKAAAAKEAAATKLAAAKATAATKLAVAKQAATEKMAAQKEARAVKAAQQLAVATKAAADKAAAKKAREIALAEAKKRRLAAAEKSPPRRTAEAPKKAPEEAPRNLTVEEAKAFRAAAERGLPPEPSAAPPEPVPAKAEVPKEHSRRVARTKPSPVDPSRIAINSIGFRPVGNGEVIIRSDKPLTYGVSGEERAVLLHLPGSIIPRPNDRRPLDTHFFDGPVLRVVPIDVKGGVDLRIELRGRAEYQLSQSGSVLTVVFSTAR